MSENGNERKKESQGKLVRRTERKKSRSKMCKFEKICGSTWADGSKFSDLDIGVCKAN